MLIEQTLFGTVDKVQQAIDLLREHEPPEGYYLCFSGGKDSTVIKALAELSGVKFDAHYQFTRIEPFEAQEFIRKYHPDIIWDYPPADMAELIVKNVIPPTRLVRYCCRCMKRCFGRGRVKITGLRGEESYGRSLRPIVDVARDGSTHVNVIKIGRLPTYGNSFTKTIFPIARCTMKASLVWAVFFARIKPKHKRNATLFASPKSSSITKTLAVNPSPSTKTNFAAIKKAQSGLRATTFFIGGLMTATQKTNWIMNNHSSVNGDVFMKNDWLTIPDAQRYKALGNGMAQPCADFILKKLMEVTNVQAPLTPPRL